MSIMTTLLLTSLLGAGINFGGQQLTAALDRKHSSAEAEKARNWEEQMSNTAYQRSVQDIENAGLNPAMLYGSGGAGMASTPSSAIGSAGSHNAGNMMNVAQAGELLNAITSARALDHKMKGTETYTTKTIYNKAGKLISEIIEDSIKK